MFPISNRFTRSGGIALLSIVWFGLIALVWRRRSFCFALLCLTALIAAFMALPARGLADATSLDGALVRHAIRLWWHDCTARDLGEGHGFTTHLFDTHSINALDHSLILPGDLAVTSAGVHIMAYVGDNQWIEADPGIGRVITVTAPAKDSLWFKGRMKIVRWNIFQ